MKSRYCIAAIALFFMPVVHAKDNPFPSDTGEVLVNACKEALEIYKSRDKRNFLAAQMTSAAEAIRAGYCIGYLQMYLKNTPSCQYYGYSSHPTNWFEFAQRLVDVSADGNNSSGSGIILEKAYCYAN